jgi:hypothetical protein
MASADFSQRLLAMLHTLFQHVCETSHGKTHHFHSIYRYYLHCRIRTVYRTLFCVANSSCGLCLIIFVSLRPEICLKLPSDSTSQWTPLLLANGWQLQAPITDSHRLVMRHAWRTTKKATKFSFCCLIYFRNLFPTPIIYKDNSSFTTDIALS